MARIAQGPRNLGRHGRRSRRYNPTPNPAVALLRNAEFFIDATLSNVSGGKLLNIGTGGTALDATFGSTTGTDTNDPTLLVHSGTNYLYLPGVNGNSAQAPDIAAYDVTGDLEVVCRVALDDWTPAADQALVCGVQADPNRRFRFRIPTSGAPTLEWWPTGSAASNIIASSVQVPPFVDGTAYWLKVTLDVDNGASGYQFRSYWAPDQTNEPTTWTELTTPAAGVGVTSIAAVTAPMEVGGAFGGAGTMAAGKFYRAIVRNGIGGTTVFDADFTRGITSGGQTTFTESSANAATVTINRATAGRKSVAVVRNVLLFGTDDYLEVADNALLNFALTDSFSVLAVFREHATPTSFGIYVSKRDSAGAGWVLLHNGTTSGRGYSVISDGVATTDTAALTGTYTQGNLTCLSAVRNVTADNLLHYANGVAAGAAVTDATTATLSNALAMRIGRSAGVATNYADMEFVAAAVFRRALTAAEIASIVAYYQAA